MRQALMALDDTVAAAERVIKLLGRSSRHQADVEELKEAKEAYCRSRERLSQVLLESRSNPSVPVDIEALRKERDHLKTAVDDRHQQMTMLLQSMRQLVSTVERSHRWESPTALPQSTGRTMPRMESEISSMDIDL